MVEGPRADGWWQASDGLWYPPETHPDGPPTGPIRVDRTPPEGVPLGRTSPPGGPGSPPGGPAYGTPAPPAPAYGTPGAGRGRSGPPGRAPARTAPPGPAAPGPRRPGPPPLPRERRSRAFGGGCLVAALTVVALVVVSVLAVRYAIDRVREEVPAAVDRAVDDARSGVGDAVDDVVGGRCELLTADQASDVLGPSRVVGLGSAASAARPVLDDRLLPDAPTCWVAAAKGRVARVARLDAADANARYDAERAKARRGPRPYFAAGVRGFGDEAFCTTLATTTAAGVFVRDGDRLVYASVTADLTDSPGGIDRVADRVAAASCRTAQQLAAAALG